MSNYQFISLWFMLAAILACQRFPKGGMFISVALAALFSFGFALAAKT